MYEIVEINGKKYAKGLFGYYEIDEQGRIRFDKGPIQINSNSSTTNKKINKPEDTAEKLFQ